MIFKLKITENSVNSPELWRSNLGKTSNCKLVNDCKHFVWIYNTHSTSNSCSDTEKHKIKHQNRSESKQRRQLDTTVRPDQLNESHITHNLPSMEPFHGKFVMLWHLFILCRYAAPAVISYPVNLACHQRLKRMRGKKREGKQEEAGWVLEHVKLQ